MQLAGVLGVEKETGFTLGYDKYNWDEHPGHFILQDSGIPGGVGRRSGSEWQHAGAALK